MRTFLERFPHLFLVDAFTKIYAIPGLRLGYGLSADADLMEKIRDVIQPWSVSIPAQEAGIAALSEDTYVHNTRWLIREERKYLARALHLLEMETFDSQANYLFFKGPEDLEEQCPKKRASDPRLQQLPGAFKRVFPHCSADQEKRTIS